MIRHTTKHQKMGWVLFLMYLALLVYFLFFAESFGRTDPKTRGYSYNLVPFKEISRFWIYREKLGIRAMMLNIVGNIVAFMPCGFFLPIVSRRSKKWYNTVIISFTFSLFVETIQLISRVGSFDVDDLLLNTTGGALGYLCFYLVQTARIRRKRREKTEV